MKIHYLFILPFIIYLNCALAQKQKKLSPYFKDRFENIHLKLAGFADYVGAVQTNDSGDEKKYDFDPALGLGTDFRISHPLVFNPALYWVLPQKSKDGGSTTNIFIFKNDLTWNLHKLFNPQLGSSLILTRISGSGGTTMVSNGTSHSKFYFPTQSTSAWNQSFDFGFETRLDEFSLQVSVMTLFPMDKERKTTNLLVSMSYLWDTK